MLKLKIISPQKVLASVEAKSLLVPGKMGEMQILPGHVALLAETNEGEAIWQDSLGQSHKINISKGVLAVEKDEVQLLCEKL